MIPAKFALTIVAGVLLTLSAVDYIRNRPLQPGRRTQLIVAGILLSIALWLHLR